MLRAWPCRGKGTTKVKQQGGETGGTGLPNTAVWKRQTSILPVGIMHMCSEIYNLIILTPHLDHRIGSIHRQGLSSSLSSSLDLDGRLGENRMEVAIVEYYGNQCSKHFSNSRIQCPLHGGCLLRQLLFGGISSPLPCPHIFLIKTDQQSTGIFLTLVYLNNLSFSAVSELPDIYN